MLHPWRSWSVLWPLALSGCSMLPLEPSPARAPFLGSWEAAYGCGGAVTLRTVHILRPGGAPDSVIGASTTTAYRLDGQRLGVSTSELSGEVREGKLVLQEGNVQGSQKVPGWSGFSWELSPDGDRLRFHVCGRSALLKRIPMLKAGI